MQLIKWDKIRTVIETTKDIETLTNIKDRLRAYQILAEQSKQSQEVQAKIAIYKARADRKCGEWLTDNIKAGNPQLSQHSTIGLKEVKLTRSESSRLQKIAAIPEDKFEAILIEAEVETRKITSNMLVNIAKEATRNERDEYLKNNPIELPQDTFQVIYADPAWEYSNSGLNSSANDKYSTMPTEEIKKIKFNTTDNAICFLWTTNPLLKDGLEVLKAWGFEYKTNFVWIKEKSNYGKLGFYIYGQHELLLIGVKGSMLPVGEKPKSIITGENKIHSKKPEIVYEIIEKMYPKHKYLELFSRNKRQGWTMWGNEI